LKRKINPFYDLPTGSKVERQFGRQMAFLPDGTVFGETDFGPRNFASFDEWRRFITLGNDFYRFPGLTSNAG
jgi:hypothetical protein